MVTALREAGRSGSAPAALATTLGVTTKELSAAWHGALAETYAPWLAASRAPRPSRVRPSQPGEPAS